MRGTSTRQPPVALALRAYLEAATIGTLSIAPGSPCENGYVESFHGKTRDESLNPELFSGLRGDLCSDITKVRIGYFTPKPPPLAPPLEPSSFPAPVRSRCCAGGSKIGLDSRSDWSMNRGVGQ